MIMFAGTVGNAVKQQALANQWMQKKNSGNVLSKQELNKRTDWTQEQWMKNTFEEQMQQDREAEYMNGIANKVMNGQDLTPDEIEYLRQKNPDMYNKYLDTKREEKAYEEKLRHCKTKDEVERIKTETVSGYLSTLKKAENSPYISDGDKMAIAQEIIGKLTLIHKAEVKFKQSAAYASLPTEAEEAIEREAEHAEKAEEVAEVLDEAAEPEEAESEEMESEITESEEAVASSEAIETEVNRAKQVASDVKTAEKVNRSSSKSHEEMISEIEKSFHRIEMNFRLAEEQKPKAHSETRHDEDDRPHVNVSV